MSIGNLRKSKRNWTPSRAWGRCIKRPDVWDRRCRHFDSRRTQECGAIGLTQMTELEDAVSDIRSTLRLHGLVLSFNTLMIVALVGKIFLGHWCR